MDNQPKIVEDVEASSPAEQSDQLKDMIKSMADAQDAINVANAAPAVEIEDEDGKPVKHLNVRLSTHETRRVMSLPVEMRARMATQILKERRLASGIRKKVLGELAVVKRNAKAKRKARAKARRRNR